MLKIQIFLIFILLLTSCTTGKPPYNDTTIRWTEEELTVKKADTHENDIPQKVYVTNSGEKFHKENCQSLSNSKHEKNYDDAIKEGFTPCGVCKP